MVTVACYTPSSKEINCNCQQRIELVVTKFITGASCSMHMHCCNVENEISRHSQDAVSFRVTSRSQWVFFFLISTCLIFFSDYLHGSV